MSVRMKMFSACVPLLALLLLTACQRGMPPVAFHADGRPPKLSDWHVVEVRDGKLSSTRRGAVRSQHAACSPTTRTSCARSGCHKGVSAKYNPTDTFDFPVGTIISKTFFYPPKGEGRKPPTSRAPTTPRATSPARVDMSQRASGRDAHPGASQGRLGGDSLCVERRDQTEATLARTGAVLPLTLVEPTTATARTSTTWCRTKASA
jgi:hypothetical protein